MMPFMMSGSPGSSGPAIVVCQERSCGIPSNIIWQSSQAEPTTLSDFLEDWAQPAMCTTTIATRINQDFLITDVFTTVITHRTVKRSVYPDDWCLILDEM